MTDEESTGFEKQVIRLADGRQLIYYRFPDAPPRSRPDPSPPKPPTSTSKRKG